MYQIHDCALCDWETTEGSDEEAFRHLVSEHGDEMELFWRLGRVE